MAVPLYIAEPTRAALFLRKQTTPKPRRTVAVRVWEPRVPATGDAGLKDPYETNLGIYQGTPSALDFPKVKKGALALKDPSAPTDPSKDRYLETSHAEPWFLRIVSATHYFAFATQLTVALAYFQYAMGQTALQPVSDLALPFLLVAGPLYQAMGGAGPNVMHEYEGFQVCPFSGFPVKDGAWADFNNDALRQVAYRSLFQLQLVGAAMFGLGAGWPYSFLPAACTSNTWAWGILAAFGVLAYLAPRDVFYWRPKLLNVQLLLPPLPTWVIALFVPAIAMQAFGLVHLLGWEVGLISAFLLAGGGMLEAGLAEGTYDQRWHLLAVIMLNGGGWMQVAQINQWWGNGVFQAVGGSVLAATLLMTGGALIDLVNNLGSSTPGVPSVAEQKMSPAEAQKPEVQVVSTR